ncbi:hypothetical protein JK361_22745 [Streptomyces sp. 5-8]|uniref:Uncharacterized protein n=1 Tax=Streptomyces musisoli TaxID=2802280 RepID=A0ABS1P4U3_9ACTN|nr:hypothetical protein [Streptomyces musisoli]MBL1107389.1 hypothetical protein [Streptomyces musisoli]
MGTSFQTPPVVQHLSFHDRQAARRRNETAYDVTTAVKALPTLHVAFQATPDAVLVSATDMDVLAAWLDVMGGTITTVDLPSGQTVWTLHTSTWTDSPRVPAVPVFVSVVQVTGESVMPEIRAAVAA